MAKIYNSKVIQNAIDGAQIQSGQDSPPDELSEKVVATLETNPRLYGVAKPAIISSSLNDSTTSTIFTAPTTSDCYLWGYTFTYSKDASSTATNLQLVAIADGDTTGNTLARIRFEPLTAGSDTITRDYTRPILLKAGSIVTITSDSGTASIDSSATLLIELVPKSFNR